jgi:hypothetical protein
LALPSAMAPTSTSGIGTTNGPGSILVLLIGESLPARDAGGS